MGAGTMSEADQALFLDRLRPGDAIALRTGDGWTPATFVSLAVDTLTLSTAAGLVYLDMWAGRESVALPPPCGITLAEGDWDRIGPPF